MAMDELAMTWRIDDLEMTWRIDDVAANGGRGELTMWKIDDVAN